MSIHQMMLSSEEEIRVLITDRTISHSPLATVTARAGIQLTAVGSANETRMTSNTPFPIAGEWLLIGSSSDYEYRYTITAGPTAGGSSGGSFGVWHDGGGATQTAYLERSATVGTSTMSVLVEIRDKSTTAVLSSATISLSATKS